MELDAAVEKVKAEKRALAVATREKQALVREVAELKAEKKEVRLRRRAASEGTFVHLTVTMRT